MPRDCQTFSTHSLAAITCAMSLMPLEMITGSPVPAMLAISG